ncbi:MAG TPA: CoA-binding protein [Syntrophorhabdaceae bacterium]
MDLNAIFKPRTLAVIGISLTKDDHPANVIFHKNLLRHRVKVYGVNGRGGTLRCEPLYKNVADLPEPIDVAVIATKADFVPQVMEECIAAGVKGAVVVSGGFAETGRADLQDRLVALARDGDFPFIGPNCLGIYAPPFIDTFFVPTERMVKPEQGRVALVSQSGGILVDHMLRCANEGVGLSAGVSIGNKALIKETDLLRYFTQDPDTDVIAFYLEGFEKNGGREFVLTAGECGKPVIVLKSGKTPGGSKAVSSHTASMAGNYEVFSAVMAQYGIIEAREESELVSFAESLSSYKESFQGRVGIITGSGGHGALAIDESIAKGLEVPALTEKEQAELRQVLSPSIQAITTYTNPIDLTGSSIDEDFVEAARYLSRKADLDCIITLVLPYLPGVTMDLGARLGTVYQQEGKPIVAYVPHVERYAILIEGFISNNIPVAHSVEAAVQMAEALRRNKRC